MKLLTVIPLLAGIAAAQTYVATQPGGPGYLTSSYNGAMTGVGPWVTLGYYKVQDGDLMLATWKGWYYGSKFWPAPGINLAPFPPPVPAHNPPFTQEVVVLSACEGQAVGYAQPWATFSGSGGGQILAAPLNAMLWSADGSSVVNLQNSNTNSRALGCDGVHQVGEDDNGAPQNGVANAMNGGSHAVMWTGTAKSQVDLHSGPFSSSEATGVNGQIQVGWGSNIFDVITQYGTVMKWQMRHATMWASTPGSIKDMNPAGYIESAFTAIGQLNASGIMVGWARPGEQTKVSPIPITVPLANHAAVWTAGGFTDLHQFLPPSFDASIALGIDPITGVIVGAAWNTAISNSLVSIAWTRQ